MINKLINLSNELDQRGLQKEANCIDSLLRKSIIGQDEAISAVAQSVKRARAGLKNPNHPIGSFMFLGPTGVGKTELAKVLSKHMFTNDESFIKIDNKSIHRLIQDTLKLRW